MGLKPAERTGPLPCAVRKDARHQAFIIVIQDRLRHAAEESEGPVVAIQPGFRRRRRIGRNKEGVAVGKRQDKVVGAQRHTGDDNIGLAEVRLGLTRWMDQRHEHLALTTTLFSHVILDDGVATRKAVLVAKTLEDPLRRMALLAVNRAVICHNTVNDSRERIQLRALR